MPAQEWDWPDNQRRGRFAPTVHPALTRERTGWASPRATRAANATLSIGAFVIKALIAIPLTALVIASVWVLAILMGA